MLTYENKYADALYHEVSIGKTVSSEEIYSVAVPYLISVDSSQDVESPDYMDVKILPYDEVLQKLIKADKRGRLEKIDKKQNIKILKSSMKTQNIRIMDLCRKLWHKTINGQEKNGRKSLV